MLGGEAIGARLLGRVRWGTRSKVHQGAQDEENTKGPEGGHRPPCSWWIAFPPGIERPRRNEGGTLEPLASPLATWGQQGQEEGRDPSGAGVSLGASS